MSFPSLARLRIFPQNCPGISSLFDHRFIPMSLDLILASGSAIRAQMLRNAGLGFEIDSPSLDEEAIRASLQDEGATARDVADALAEAKARRISAKGYDLPVLGCDQVLSCDQRIYGKAQSREEAKAHLVSLRGKTHHLLSAAVLFEGGEPIWRHVGVARLSMRAFSDAALDSYLDRAWPGIASSVGGYKLEAEGVRLFSQIQGDYFTILGLPLIELLNHLTLTGKLPT